MATISRRTRKKANAKYPDVSAQKAKAVVSQIAQRLLDIGKECEDASGKGLSVSSKQPAKKFRLPVMLVDHPAHYNTGKIEVIDFIEDQKLGFHLGNVVKYIARSAHKGSELQDLEKAAWYLQRKIKGLKQTDHKKD